MVLLVLTSPTTAAPDLDLLTLAWGKYHLDNRAYGVSGWRDEKDG